MLCSSFRTAWPAQYKHGNIKNDNFAQTASKKDLIMLNIYAFMVVSLVIAAALVENCEIVTRSTVDGELSLFAGREWGESSEILEVAIGIPVKMDAIFGNLLINYVEGLNDSHALLALGQGMLLNHVNDRSQETVRKIMSPYSPLYEFKSHSGYSVDIAYELRGYVDVGEEFLTDYAVEGWFEDRSLPYHPPNSLKYPTAHPGCPSTLTFIYMQGLYANKKIAQGSVIETSRAIFLPITPSLMQSGPLVEFLWWPADMRDNSSFIASSSVSDGVRSALQENGAYFVAPYDGSLSYAVLLSGRGALYSTAHKSDKSAPTSADTLPNAQYAWSCGTQDNVCSNTCSLLSVVTFTALRDIEAGEKLVIDLAEDSVSHFRYPSKEFSVPCMQPG